MEVFQKILIAGATDSDSASVIVKSILPRLLLRNVASSVYARNHGPTIYMMPEDVLSSSLPSDWRYVSEGGASIVFSYHGPQNLHLDGTVLRLRKSPRPKPSDINDVSPSSPQTDTSIADADEDPSIAFQDNVISQLISPAFLPRLWVVPVSRNWLEELALLAENRRPVERRTVSQIDVSHHTAVLATDLVGHESLAIEIKVRLNPHGLPSSYS